MFDNEYLEYLAYRLVKLEFFLVNGAAVTEISADLLRQVLILEACGEQIVVEFEDIGSELVFYLPHQEQGLAVAKVEIFSQPD